MKKHRSAKIAEQNKDAIKALEEILGSLRITEDNVSNRSKKHIVDFMIKFEVLAMKADTDDLHTIFLLKKSI